jgi:hypothetical protein
MSKNLENEDETSSSADEEHILFITQFIKIQNEYREKVRFKEGGVYGNKVGLGFFSMELQNLN